MLGSPRKRNFDTVRDSHQRSRTQDNPWFRDPDHDDERRDYKCRKQDLSPPRSKDRNRDKDRDRRSYRSSAPSNEKSTRRERTREGLVQDLPRPTHIDDAVEDGEIAEGLDYSDRPPSPPPAVSNAKSDRGSDRDRRSDAGRSLEKDRSREKDRDRERERERRRDDHSPRYRDRSRERRLDRHDHERPPYHPRHPSGSDRRSERRTDRPSSPPRRRFFDDEPYRRGSHGSRTSHEDRHRQDRSRSETNHERKESEATKSLDSSSMKMESMFEEEEPIVEEDKPTEEEILEQARRKRAEILAKHQLSQVVNSSHLSTTINHTDSMRLDPTSSSASSKPPLNHLTSETSSLRVSALNSPANRLRLGTDTPQQAHPGSDHASDSIPGSPEPVVETNTFDLTQDLTSKNEALLEDEETKNPKHPLDQPTATESGHQSISAADYNPDDDRRLDDERQQGRHEGGINNKVSLTSKPKEVNKELPIPTVIDSKVNGDHESDEEEDDDDGDEDDMFAIEPSKKTKKKKNGTNGHHPTNGNVPFLPVINRAGADADGLVVDNFDDADGYYRVILGELLDNGRYHVHANLGKGMFASVVRAKDMQHNPTKDGSTGLGRDVAIKVVRSQESMYKAGQKEASILKKLQETDPNGKYHVIRLERTFEHRGHLCLVFEAMSMNLREVVKRFGKDVGINLRAVRAYAHQMFLALSLMKKCNIMHADLKPDNILVSESKSVLKVCDLGSASDVSENEITPYLVSRFYRAPEIILGLPYDCSIDVWSIGCTLYELYTGKILFPGRSNNHLLLLIMELKGRFNSKSLKKAKFYDVHFDEENGNFLSVEKNKLTGADVIKSINVPNKPSQTLQSRLMPNHVTKKMQDSDVKLLGAFVDLLEKILNLEPSKRISPKEALNHPFIRGV
ncbi:CMGC/DYRK/PRP4 protein kinase [Melampsora americana]|nr:CMGC/DYRK/PRP4 protein kinase [Melampsora americana]